MTIRKTANQTEKNRTTSESSDDVQTTKSRIKWNYGQTSTLINFWKSNIDNIDYIESPISNNIWAKIKLKVDKQGPTKTIKQCKASLRTLKDAYKKAKDNNVKTGAAPMIYPFSMIQTEFQAHEI